MPAVPRLLQVGWAVLQLGALAVAVAATPALHARYQTPCPEHICDVLPQPNAQSIEWLARLGVSLSDYATVMVGVEWVALLVWAALGAVIVWKQPRDLVGLLLAYGGIWASSKAFLDALHAAQPTVVLPMQMGLVTSAVVFPLIVALFPDGRWVPSWTRWVALVAIGYGLATMTSHDLSATLAVLELPFGLAPWVVLLGAQVYRYRRVSGVIERQQTKWLLFGVGLFVVNVALLIGAATLGLVAQFQFVFLAFCYGGFLGMGIAVGFGILRYRLFAIDAILNRALVYGALTAAVIGLYALIVGGLGMLLQSRGNAVANLLAAAVVAVVFAPLRDRLQRGANRLLYGERDDPYAVIAKLGRRLEESLAPEATLPVIVETVAGALKLPYAAIALHEGDGSVVVAEHGVSPPSALEIVPLTHQGAPVGELRLAARAGEKTLSNADRRLLDDLAAQAGVAVRAVQLTYEVQRARERLVTAREEERRRLRRDLHDGLGPLLGGQALTIDAARALMLTDAEEADRVLRDLKAQGQAAVADIRRLIYALRPPALDDFGLLAAVRQEAAACERAGVRVSIDAPDPLPPLPAAVEVAVLRIAQEALTNVTRHADARSCSIRVVLLDTPRSLRLEVVDDGRGLDAARRPGVGMSSMRERAEELGGTFAVTQGPERGTRVHVHLPLPEED